MVTMKKRSMLLGVVGAIASFTITVPSLAADRILWSIKFANKTYEIALSIAGVERFAQTGDISGLPPKFSFLNLTPEFKDYLREQLNTPISSKSTLAHQLENLLQLLLPTSNQEQRQLAVKLLVQKANGRTAINFLKALPVDTITPDNFWGLLNDYEGTASPELIPVYAGALYGITFDGVLLQIDTKTGAGKQIRSQLAPEFRSTGSLAFIDGNFYASVYNTGQIIRFGFTDGDEVALGNSGFPYVEAITERSDGILFASISRNNDVAAEAVGRLDINTGAVSDIVSSADQTWAWDLNAIEFDSHGTLYGINLNNPRSLFAFNLADGTISNKVSLSNIYSAMAIDRNSDTFYGTNVHGIFLSSLPSELFIINPMTGSETLVGNIGYSNIGGLTFVPDFVSEPTRVPEPSSTLGLLAFATFGLSSLLKRKRQQKFFNFVVRD